jgi:hypothetical protein
MVIDLPTADDFFASGKQLLDFAWDVVAKLLRDIDQAEFYGVDPVEISDSYWSAAKGRLATALSITQQGVEFILKGKIAAISPYLLIADPPSRWPSPYVEGVIKFSDFRSVDAQDLIRVLDTFSAVKLAPTFVEQFHLLREKRNRIMHSIDKKLVIDVTEVIESLLSMHKALFPEESWPHLRVQFLQNAPEAELGAYEYAVNAACWETTLVMKLLSPSNVKTFLGIDKKQRQYFCPECLATANTDIDFEYKLAVLEPKGASATKLYCPICDANYVVARETCENCPGNVLSKEGVCLTCGG